MHSTCSSLGASPQRRLSLIARFSFLQAHTQRPEITMTSAAVGCFSEGELDGPKDLGFLPGVLSPLESDKVKEQVLGQTGSPVSRVNPSSLRRQTGRSWKSSCRQQFARGREIVSPRKTPAPAIQSDASVRGLERPCTSPGRCSESRSLYRPCCFHLVAESVARSHARCSTETCTGPWM
eukprot:768471-Hanusia_phi.AAC.1